MPLALLIEMVEITNVEPLAGKLRGEPTHTIVAQHPFGFLNGGLRIMQRALGRGFCQTGVWLRRPEEIA